MVHACRLSARRLSAHHRLSLPSHSSVAGNGRGLSLLFNCVSTVKTVRIKAGGEVTQAHVGMFFWGEDGWQGWYRGKG